MTYYTLQSLDDLLSPFTEEEIKESIKRANVVADTEIDDKRLLIKYGNYKLPLLTKEITSNLNIYEFIADNYNDKEIKNIIFNKIASIIKDPNRIDFYKNVIYKRDAESFIRSLNYVTYVELRELYFYLYNYVDKKEVLRDNNRKREKTNE